ncbi:hypothetical protein HMPREF1549_00240 [Actinomyces johnsonii F0510]|uniref:Uncharacterized protein n=1 Tax=Actinomyces johnsonii F0510 TaxID=1227262 RepID=U1QM58_9ACTO|nr:hypothetical protein HMPREF1549_00240 [Actinomyces johnsonii F0510]
MTIDWDSAPTLLLPRRGEWRTSRPAGVIAEDVERNSEVTSMEVVAVSPVH